MFIVGINRPVVNHNEISEFNQWPCIFSFQTVVKSKVIILIVLCNRK